MVFVVQSVTDKFVYRFSVQLWKRRPERWAKLLLLGPIRSDPIRFLDSCRFQPIHMVTLSRKSYTVYAVDDNEEILVDFPNPC